MVVVAVGAGGAAGDSGCDGVALHAVGAARGAADQTDASARGHVGRPLDEAHPRPTWRRHPQVSVTTSSGTLSVPFRIT